MTNKHSPGPWGISTNKLATGPVVVDCDGYPIAVVDPVAITHINDRTVVIRGTEQVSADANLIISAPVMFDALVGIATVAQAGPPEKIGYGPLLASGFDEGWSAAMVHVHSRMRPVMVAIAKARGKSVFGNDWQDALDGLDHEPDAGSQPGKPGLSPIDYVAACNMMERIGGSFASSIATAYSRADSKNRAIPERSFHDLFERYDKLAKQDAGERASRGDA